MVFGSISSNIDKVPSIKLSANPFVFADFNIHHKNWLIYSGGTDRAKILNDLTQMVNFRTCIPGCDSQSPALFYLFL